MEKYKSGKYIGLMTGTSMDGADLAIADFRFEDNFLCNLLHFYSFDFPRGLKEKLKQIIHEPIPISLLSEVNFELSKFYADCINNALQYSNISPESILAAGVHGQTLWHSAEKAGKNNHTYQLACGNVISALSRITTVTDFRSADIALGGTGAPLVPIFDYYFLQDSNTNSVVLNIGGISNITVIPQNAKRTDVIAFDCGPGNAMIDEAMVLLYNEQYDNSGNIASGGNVINEILNGLLELEYLKLSYPKSSGRELFNLKLLNQIDLNSYNKADIIRTLTEFSALCIANSINSFKFNSARIISSGGGVKNEFLISLLKKHLPHYQISNSDIYGIPAQAKEALAFAFLASLGLSKIPANIPSVTGASKETLLGCISFVDY